MGFHGDTPIARWWVFVNGKITKIRMMIGGYPPNQWHFMETLIISQGGAPPVISWFIIPITIDITPINPSYNTYKPT